MQNDYIICYDIANNKRLAKLARFLEKKAIRIQFSIFFLPDCNKDKIYDISQQIVDIINSKEDDVRIYKIKNYGINLGEAYDLSKINIFI